MSVCVVFTCATFEYDNGEVTMLKLGYTGRRYSGSIAFRQDVTFEQLRDSEKYHHWMMEEFVHGLKFDGGKCALEQSAIGNIIRNVYNLNAQPGCDLIGYGGCQILLAHWFERLGLTNKALNLQTMGCPSFEELVSVTKLRKKVYGREMMRKFQENRLHLWQMQRNKVAQCPAQESKLYYNWLVN